MNFLNNDVIINIVSFVSYDDVKNLRKVNRYFKNIFLNDYVWVILGRRDKLYLEIETEFDYRFNSPFYVCDKEIKNYIQTDSWASRKINTKRINRNGLKDHRINAFIESIVRNIIIIDKLRKMKRSDMCLDWKISLTKTIEEYSDVIEKENDEMELILKSL